MTPSVDSPLQDKGRGRAALKWITLGGLMLLGAVAGWLARAQLIDRENQALRQRLYLQTMVRVHRMFAPDRGIAPTFPPDDLDRFVRSIEQQLGIAPELPRRSELPLSYRGGRIFPLRGGPAALLIFGSGDEWISVVMTSGDVYQLPDRLDQDVDGTAVAVTSRGALRVVVVGHLEPSVIDRVVATIVPLSGVH